MRTLAEQAGALRTQLIGEHAQAPGLFAEMARLEGMLAETYRARVLYELLQNSDDAGSSTVTVDLTAPGQMAWINDGRPFDGADIEALCRSASSTKKVGDGAIGYRGIGFKAIAALASRVRLMSNGAAIAFDRQGAAEALGTSADAVPLLRVPASVTRTTTNPGSEFHLDLVAGSQSQLVLDPIAMVFLRNVANLTILRPDGRTRVSCDRSDDWVRLDVDGRVAEFARAADGDTVVLIPINPQAEAIAGRRGRLCCFLPLEDELALPVIASGHLLTDPSRTHAVAADVTTRSVVSTVGRLLTTVLADPEHPACDQLWSLLLTGEDLRPVLMGGETNPAGMLMPALRAGFAETGWSFSFTEVPLDPEDVDLVFPGGAPPSIYRREAASAARGLRTAFAAPTLRVQQILNNVEPDAITDATRELLAKHVIDLARAEGRSLNAREQLFATQATNLASRSVEPGQNGRSAASEAVSLAGTTGQRPSLSFSGAISRWRAGEIAVMEFLNDRGWHLRDVSRQNVGYDLSGTNAEGAQVHVEVKKVDGKDARFSMTNNETATMVGESSRYLLALAIGDGQAAQLALLDPLRDQIPREKVCRRWEWEYTDWSRFATIVE